MPRQAIRPEYRQRVSEACRPCKASKKRCDSGHPCALCIKRDRVSSCVYSAPEDRRRPRNSERISTRHASPASISVNVNRSVASATPRSYSWPPKEPQISMEHETPAAIEDVYLPKSRILLTSAGEKVYTGDTASLSFLQFLRQVLNQQMGPSLFTETKLHNVMLEVPQQGSIQDFEQDPKMVRLLIEGFFVSSSGFLDVYTKSEMAELLIGMDNVSSKATDYRSAALYVAIAIGGQSRADSPLDLQYAREYFARGQRAAFAGMLEDPSIDLIRLFLLMAFYMLGACRRNTAFTYIGIAARAAHTLGLHATAKSRAFDDAEENLRLRIWRSVTIIDMVVSSILARPPATVRTCASSPCDTNIYKPYCQTSNLAVNAAFRVCTIIRDIIKDSGETTDADTASANKSLDKLKQWVADLPNELRRFSETVPLESSDHALVVGNLHVACVYYFTVMLVTRPFLISHLMSRLPKNSSGATCETRTTEPIEDIRLAQICIDTAIYMAQASRHALAAGVLLNNMCIMKAWLFAAGLVLGFSIFGHGEVRFDVEEAFQSVREVLEKFSHQSPQAKHYYEVLTSFNHAISQHRQRIAQQQRLNNAPYITQILRIESNDTLDQHSSTPNETNQEFHVTDTGTLENCPNAEMSLGTSQLDSNFDQIIASWDPIANQISENYPFDILEGLFTEI